MALETLKGLKIIDGFDVAELNKLAPKRPSEFIVVNHENNGISFKIQQGAIKENGVNGCQVDTIIETAKIIVEGLNKNFPCEENNEVIKSLEEALSSLRQRKENREQRGVEGYSKG